MLAYGINTSFAQLAIVVTNAVVPEIYEISPHGEFGYAFLLGSGCAFFAELSSVVISAIDKVYLHKTEEHIESDAAYKTALISENAVVGPPQISQDSEEETNDIGDISNSEASVDNHRINHEPINNEDFNGSGSVVVNHNMLIQQNEPEVNNENQIDQIIVEDGVCAYINNFLTSLRGFSAIFWCLIFSNFLAYASFFTMIDNANDMLRKNFDYTHIQSGRLLTVVFLISGICSPIFGVIMRRMGRKILLLMISLLLFIIGLIVLISLHGCNYLSEYAPIPFVFVGLFYAMNFGLVWTCISLVVDETKMGSAFGIVYSTRNINMVVSSYKNKKFS